MPSGKEQNGKPGPASPPVAVVIPCFRHAHFLPKAIESAIEQSVAPAEVIVVDDGPDEDTAAVARRYGNVTLVRQENRGLAGARNTGLRAATSDKIIFLDADDVLLPSAISAGLRCFSANPAAGFVYGGFREVRGETCRSGFCAVSSHRDLVACNWIGCPAAAMFDRAKLLAIGGFDESLGMCEDWDAFLRLSREHPFGAHPETVAVYSKHDSNMSNDLPELRRWIEVVRAKEWDRGLDEDGQIAWRDGERLWRSALDPDRKPPPLLERVARAFARRLPRPLGK